MKLLDAALSIGLAGAALIYALTLAHAHGWYSAQCCRDQDCHPVPCDEVTVTADGGWKWKSIKFERSTMRYSQDDGCHVCVSISQYGRCIYLPWGT